MTRMLENFPNRNFKWVARTWSHALFNHDEICGAGRSGVMEKQITLLCERSERQEIKILYSHSSLRFYKL
jgi:hypothetical protein